MDGVAGAWDAIVSCFFIDTAHNVVEYLQVIARALKPGGVRPNWLPVCCMHIPAVNYTCQCPAWYSFVQLVRSSCCRRADSSSFAGVDKFGTITLSFCWIILPRRGNVCVWTFWISCFVLNYCLSLTFKHETLLCSRSWVWNQLTLMNTCNGKAGNVIRAQLTRCEEGCLTAWPYFEGMKLWITKYT